MSQGTQRDELVPLPDMSDAFRRHKDWSEGFDDDTTHRIKQTIRRGPDTLRGEFGNIVTAVSRRLELYLKPRGITGPCLDTEVMEFLAFAFRWKCNSLERAWEEAYAKKEPVYDSRHNIAQPLAVHQQ